MRKFIFQLLSVLLIAGCTSDHKNGKNHIGKQEETDSSVSKYDFVIENSCGFDRKLINKKVYSFDSDLEAEDALKKIMKLTGLPPNFKIRSASIDNACAVIKCDNQGNCDRYILYNQEFMERVKDQTTTHYSELAVLSHEIAHHLSGHTLSNSGSSYDMELESDKFAGFMLYKLGASIEDTKKSYSNLNTHGSQTHPPRSARIAAVISGWYDAKRNGEVIVSEKIIHTSKTRPEVIEQANTNNQLTSTLAELKRYAKWCDANNSLVSWTDIHGNGENTWCCFLYLDDITRNKYGNGKKMIHIFKLWPVTNNINEYGHEMWPINEVTYVLSHKRQDNSYTEYWTFDKNNRILGCFGGRTGYRYTKLTCDFYDKTNFTFRKN